jgi:hypothetical protein
MAWAAWNMVTVAIKKPLIERHIREGYSISRVLFTADAHRDNGKRFIVTADEKLTAFLELERVTRSHAVPLTACPLEGQEIDCEMPSNYSWAALARGQGGGD